MVSGDLSYPLPPLAAISISTNTTVGIATTIARCPERTASQGSRIRCGKGLDYIRITSAEIYGSSGKFFSGYFQCLK
jgi:hypothetical protein